MLQIPKSRGLGIAGKNNGYMKIQAQNQKYSRKECPQQVKKDKELKQYMKATLRGPYEL